MPSGARVTKTGVRFVRGRLHLHLDFIFAYNRFVKESCRHRCGLGIPIGCSGRLIDFQSIRWTKQRLLSLYIQRYRRVIWKRESSVVATEDVNGVYRICNRRFFSFDEDLGRMKWRVGTWCGGHAGRIITDRGVPCTLLQELLRMAIRFYSTIGSRGRTRAALSKTARGIRT
jgi:hypothetical protein